VHGHEEEVVATYVVVEGYEEKHAATNSEEDEDEDEAIEPLPFDGGALGRATLSCLHQHLDDQKLKF
jgi:hypothetical protein